MFSVSFVVWGPLGDYMKKILFVLFLCLIPSGVFAIEYEKQYAFEYPPDFVPNYVCCGYLSYDSQSFNYNADTGILVFTPLSSTLIAPYSNGPYVRLHEYSGGVWSEIGGFFSSTSSLPGLATIFSLVEQPNIINSDPALGSVASQYPQGIPALIPPPPPPPLPGPMDALFTASDFSGFAGNVSILLIVFIGVYLLFLGYRYVKNSIGRIVV